MKRCTRPFWLTKKELLELKKQLNDLISNSYIRPNKSLYKASLFFVDKRIVDSRCVSNIGA